MNDLLASGILLGGSSVALALTALAARRAKGDRRRAEFAAKSAHMAWRAAHRSAVSASARASDAGDWCEASKRHAANAMQAANAIELSAMLSTAKLGPIVTLPETVDVIPIPVQPLKLYAEVDDTPGSVVDADEAGSVIEFAHYWRDNGDAGA